MAVALWAPGPAGPYSGRVPNRAGLLVPRGATLAARCPAEGSERPALRRVADTLRCIAEAREASLRGEAYAMKGVVDGRFPHHRLDSHICWHGQSGRGAHTRLFVSCAVPGDTRGGVLVAPGPAPAHNETAPERSFSGAVGQRRGRKVPRGTRPGGSSGGLGGAADESQHRRGSLGAGPAWPIQRKSPGARGFWCSYACGIPDAEGAERPPCGAWRILSGASRRRGKRL